MPSPITRKIHPLATFPAELLDEILETLMLSGCVVGSPARHERQNSLRNNINENRAICELPHHLQALESMQTETNFLENR